MLPIVIPTHGRAGNVKTLKIIPPSEVSLCVAESQVDAYAEHYSDVDYLVHPDTVKGLSAKRQWIYEKLGDVFMLDDDIERVADMAAGPGERNAVPPEKVRPIIERGFEEAKEIGAFMWSFSSANSPIHFKPQQPFQVKGWIPGHATGIRAGSKLWWPQNLDYEGLEDAWISALNAHHHRLIWKNLRYAFSLTGTFQTKGGLATTRTVAGIRRGIDRLRENFGDAIHTPPANKPGSEWQTNLSLPF